jgi:NAD(P)-dependent dehydrogenase (short-subunit alcohol dehydrogenase family)
MIRGGRGGSILNVASIEGTRAAPMYAVYAACKAGMISFTRSMSLELAPHAIRVNCIAPDHTATPGNRGNRTGPVDPSSWPEQTPEREDVWRRLVPLGREGVDAECGDVAVFLSSAMSRYVTGTTVPVDGGTWASSGWFRSKKTDEWTLVDGLELS